MHKILPPLIALIFSISIYAQKATDPEVLARQLTVGLKDDSSKVDTIYKWITHNIHFDYDITQKGKCFAFQSSEEVLKQKKTLPDGYSRLMRDMLVSVNIKASLIPGYTYQTKDYYQPNILFENHQWVAYKIGNEWHLADPTWDAGYVGSLAAHKLEQKLEKKNKKLEAKNKKREKSKKDPIPLIDVDSLVSSKKLNDKMGFIPEPTTEFFNTTPEKFLLRHLPANPMWQLVDNPITIETFLESDSIILKSVKKDSSTPSTYQSKIDTFMNLNFMDQILFTGMDAYEFYPKNSRVIAYYLYYYLQILNTKEIQKAIKQLNSIKLYKLKLNMQPVIDTALGYTKDFEKIEKVRHKELNQFYKSLEKNSYKHNKYYTKISEKAESWQEKYGEKIEKRQEKLNKELTKLNAASGYNRLPNKSELEFNTSTLPEFAQEYIDSSKAILNSFHKEIETHEKWTNNSAFEQIVYYQDFSIYLLQKRSLALAHKAITLNDYLNRIDSALTNCMDSLDILYNSHLLDEVLRNDAYKSFQALEKYVAEIDSEISMNLAQGQLKDDKALREHLSKSKNYMSSTLVKHTETALNHNMYILNNWKVLENKWNIINDLVKDQDKLTEEKNEYLVEQAEIDHKREEDLAENITKLLNIWAKKVAY